MPPRSRLSARVDRLADDAVHAGERADVDDAVRALARQADRLADVQHHLAQRAVARQVGPRALQHLVDVGLLVADEIVPEGLHQHVLVMLLHALAHPRPQRFEGDDLPLELELPELLGVGVPDPLDDVGEPGLGAVFLQAPDQVLVRERVQAAENLAHNADQRRGAVALRGDARGSGRGSASRLARMAPSCSGGSVGAFSIARQRSSRHSS